MTLNQLPELKEAILNQSQKEKDKLLVRLINKDKRLIEQLHFLLLENEDDLLDRIQKIKTRLEDLFAAAQQFISRKKSDYKHKELTAWLKSASGLVNEHASITKNKESELDLRLLILEEAFDTYFNFYQSGSSGFKSDAHFTYVAARIKAILTIYNKLHEDLQFEYRDRIDYILEFAKSTELKSYIDF